MKKIVIFLLVAALAVVVAGCKKQEPGPGAPPDLTSVSEPLSEPDEPTASSAAAHNERIDPKDVHLTQFSELDQDDTIAVITTSMGEIKARLFREQAPETVGAFESLAKSGHYNGQEFDSIVSGYKIEGCGDPSDNTFPENLEYSLDLWNFRGAVALSNNGSDFMIVQAVRCLNPISELEEINFPEKVIEKYQEVGGAPSQDWKNAVFGQVIEGMDVVDKIARIKIGDDGKPLEPVIISDIKFESAQLDE